MAERALTYLSGATIGASVYLGDQLGLYRSLQGAGEVTSAELADRAGLNERWVREWLHSQASAGLLRYAGGGRFELTPEQAAVLADEQGPSFMGGGFALVYPLLGHWDRYFEAFKSGLGVRYEHLGRQHAVGESRFTAPWLTANLVPRILPALEGVTDRLATGAKVADIGCGSGRATLEMARAFPASRFHGYDSSETAVALAEERLASSGLTNASFHLRPAQAIEQDQSFDFILTWDCLHDMTNPRGAMEAIRGAIKPDGTWLIVDVNGRATPEENYEEPLAGLLYAVSILDCLAVGTCEEGGAGLGTLGLPEPVARAMTSEAGFRHFTVHDFDSPVNSFFEVRP